MTDKELNNSFNSPDTEYKTRLTVTIDVPLHLEDLRAYVSMVDSDGGEEPISPANVSALDFITLWLLGEYSGDALVITDDMKVIK